MRLVVQQCLDWDYVLLVDKDSGKTVVRFEYDDSPTKAIEHVVKALKYTGVTVGEEEVPVKPVTRDTNSNVLGEGSRVVTVQSDRVSNDWMPEAHIRRKFGVMGVIIAEHNSHGLCYDVKHSDGTVGCYDPWELVVVK